MAVVAPADPGVTPPVAPPEAAASPAPSVPAPPSPASAPASPPPPAPSFTPPANTVPMMSPSGQLGYVPQEKVDGATQARYERAVQVVSPTGQKGFIAESKLDAAKEKGFKEYVAPPPPGPIQKVQNYFDKNINDPALITHGADTFRGNVERFVQGTGQGMESVLVHPLETAHSAIQLPMDILRATGTSPEFIGQHESDPEVVKSRQEARDRLAAQWDEAKKNPANTLGQLVGGGLISHGIGEVADAGIRAGARAVRGTGEAVTGAADVVSGASEAVRKAGEKAATTQTAAGTSNSAALADYADKVEKATQTVDEQKASAAKKVADWDAMQRLDHATKVEHLEAQTAADEQATNLRHDEAQTQAQKLYAQNVNDVADLDTQRGTLARQEKQARLQLMRTVQEQEAKAHVNAAGQFNDVREAIGNTEAPVSTLGDSVKAAVAKNIRGSAEKIKIFDDMLNRAKNTGEQAQLTQGVIKSQGFPGDYDTLSPEHKAVVDKIVGDINTRSGVEPEPPKTMSWDNWRGYSSELGRMMQNPNLESDVRGALQDVKNHVDAVAQKMAEDAGPGVGDKFRAAKQNWSIYKQVFHEPEGPSGSGSRVAKSFNAEDAFNATEPFLHKDEFVASRARNMLVGDPNAGPGGYHNPEAGQMVDRLRGIKAQQEALAEGKIVEPPALKPDAEPVDIRQVKLKAYQTAADKLKELNKFQVRAILGIGGGVIAHVLGEGSKGSFGYGVGTTLGLTGLGMLVDSDTFKSWISKPRPRDFRMLEKLDNANKIRVKDGIADSVVQLVDSGQKVKVSPETQAFLGPENILKIAKAISKTKGGVSGMTGAEKVRAAVKTGLAGAGAVGATGASRVETGTSEGAGGSPAPVPAKPENSETMVEPNPKGLIKPGNLPIWNRPTIQNADGSHSSEYSTSFQDDAGHEVLVPTIVNGHFLTPDGKKPPEGSKAEKEMFQRAWHHYQATGENLGSFDNADNADTYAGKLHNRGTR